MRPVLTCGVQGSALFQSSPFQPYPGSSTPLSVDILLKHALTTAGKKCTVPHLTVGSPQPAVVDDESSIVVLDGGVEPLHEVRGRPRASLGLRAGRPRVLWLLRFALFNYLLALRGSHYRFLVLLSRCVREPFYILACSRR